MKQVKIVLEDKRIRYFNFHVGKGTGKPSIRLAGAVGRPLAGRGGAPKFF